MKKYSVCHITHEYRYEIVDADNEEEAREIADSFGVSSKKPVFKLLSEE